MWALIYLLIFLVPVGLIILVFLLIGAAGANVYRTGKRAYQDIKPHIDQVAAGAKRAQDRGMSFAARGQKIAEVANELGGRWQYVTHTLAENKKSPVVTAAALAGRVSAMVREQKKPES